MLVLSYIFKITFNHALKLWYWKYSYILMIPIVLIVCRHIEIRKKQKLINWHTNYYKQFCGHLALGKSFTCSSIINVTCTIILRLFNVISSGLLWGKNFRNFSFWFRMIKTIMLTYQNIKYLIQKQSTSSIISILSGCLNTISKFWKTHNNSTKVRSCSRIPENQLV